MKYSPLILFSLLWPLISFSQMPIFSIVPRVPLTNPLIKTEQGTAIFQITNNTNHNLDSIDLVNLPTGVSQVLHAGVSYCARAPFNLESHQSCLLKLLIDTTYTPSTLNSGPRVCFSASHPLYCSQPLLGDQLSTDVLNESIPSSCAANVSNFLYELFSKLDDTSIPINVDWGPYQNALSLSPSDPDLTACSLSAGPAWQQERLLAAANYWIGRKLNYCHHHVVDWPTPLSNRGATTEEGGYCSPKLDIMPGTPYYNQLARWNYSGSGSETLQNWQNNNLMWYGLDCSNYTGFLYNFALGIIFDTATGSQAGQASDGSQSNLCPNGQTSGNELRNPFAAGGELALVCADNTVEDHHRGCFNHGGYISAFKSNCIETDHSLVTSSMLDALHPGDLLFIAASLSDGTPSADVTHVVMWTGKKVGTGPNDINPSLIAPDELCPQSEWMPHTGDWVITDSHYQGADYRVITPCFYLNNLWGIRRVIV